MVKWPSNLRAFIVINMSLQTSKTGKLPIRQNNKDVRMREYLTEQEVEMLMDAARKTGRYGHRDFTLILMAYRHGLRVSELVNCDGIRLI